MRSRYSFALALVLIAGLSACAIGVRKTIVAVPGERYMPARAEGTTLRAASFNILQAGNKKFPWEERREAVADCLRDIDPDVFGLQEVLWSQLEYLADALPNYTCVGRGRDDGHLASEFMALFFRTNRFILKKADVFWLSDTPEVAGSNQWGGACVRCATVAILIDRTDGTSVGVCNTHLDHISAAAREKGAKLIRQRLSSYGSGLKWVVTGDFNTKPGSAPYVALVGAQAGRLPLIDTFAAVHPSAPPDTASFHGYAESKKESRIDWILAGPALKPLAAGIVQFRYRGRYPSDHWAVWADLK